MHSLSNPHSDRLPALFISHGSPMLGFQDDAYTRALRNFALSFKRPEAIVVASAHWLTPGPIQITADEHPETIHDFVGFPEELYEMRYSAPGSQELAYKIATLLTPVSDQTTLNGSRGLDHGVWMPLQIMYPEADIPVVQISLPLGKNPREIMKIGKSLSSLREDGILLMGSGGVVHNLKKLRWNEKYGAPDGWALEFETWVKDQLKSANIEALLNFESSAPKAALAHPTVEHILPLFFSIGSSIHGDGFFPIYEGIEYGNLSLFSFCLKGNQEPHLSVDVSDLSEKHLLH